MFEKNIDKDDAEQVNKFKSEICANFSTALSIMSFSLGIYKMINQNNTPFSS